MFISADTMTLLLNSGLPSDKLVEIVHALERDASAVSASRSTSAERQARYRARVAERNTSVTRDVTGDATSVTDPLPLSPSPQTPQPHTPTPVEITTRARGADFEAFWAAYPAKVGKKSAETAWAKAKDRPALDDVLAAIDAYRRAKPPDRDWCHPATWLNQGRWSDEHPDPTTPAVRPRNDRPDRFAAKQANYESALAGAEWADQVLADRGAF